MWAVINGARKKIPLVRDLPWSMSGPLIKAVAQALDVNYVAKILLVLLEKLAALSIRLNCAGNEERECSEYAPKAAPREALVPKRVFQKHGCPTSHTADEGAALASNPAYPNTIFPGKLLGMDGPKTLWLIILAALLYQEFIEANHGTAALLVLFSFALSYFLYVPAHDVFLLDIACFGPPQQLRVSIEDFIAGLRAKQAFTDTNISFMERIMLKSGLGPATALPEGIIRVCRSKKVEQTTLEDALSEAEWVMFDCVAALLKKTRIHPKEVDVVITSCSCFAPTPSMAAMILNKFKMRSDVATYSLAGMGCSSSIICVDLAKQLLQAQPDCRILIVNHENISNNCYRGNTQEMLVPLCLFRMGGGAALLSNKPSDAPQAKYELLHTLRTHLGNDDEAFMCMGTGQDEEGKVGVFLQKTVTRVALRALYKHLSQLAPKVLPLGEQIKFLMDRKYVPSFKVAFDHFLVHPGGRGVLDSLQKELRLTDADVEPARQTLYRFGNVSAASTWYILAYIEQKVGIRKGARLWQLGFGGGFKANSAVWRARRNIDQKHACWRTDWPSADKNMLERYV
eukprot:jgi/Botrbrau1/18610/Bobra.0367s0050.1